MSHRHAYTISPFFPAPSIDVSNGFPMAFGRRIICMWHRCKNARGKLKKQKTNIFFAIPGSGHSEQGRGMGSKLFGGVAPGFQPRTSCSRVRSVIITITLRRPPQKTHLVAGKLKGASSSWQSFSPPSPRTKKSNWWNSICIQNRTRPTKNWSPVRKLEDPTQFPLSSIFFRAEVRKKDFFGPFQLAFCEIARCKKPAVSSSARVFFFSIFYGQRFVISFWLTSLFCLPPPPPPPLSLHPNQNILSLALSSSSHFPYTVHIRSKERGNNR